MTLVTAFFDDRTSSVQYVAADEATKCCAIIDPVLDFNVSSASVSTDSADRLLRFIRERGYRLEWILDTHPHADHFSAACYLKEQTGASTGIGERVRGVQSIWKGIYGLGDEFVADGRHWDRLFADGETFKLGSRTVKVVLSPGHTLASVTYVFGDAAFIHDTLFMPDVGTARTDFPGGSAADLWDSIQRILSLPEQTRLFTGHDYPPEGRKPAWESTIAQQKSENVHLLKCRTAEAFIDFRTARDKTLPLPALMLFALQVNIRGGRLPEPVAGKSSFTIPINAFPAAVREPRR